MYLFMRHTLFREAFVVTCYFRHLKEVFAKAGIEVTNENKRDVDRVIHAIVGVAYKDCPGAWREVKKKMAEDEDAFVSELKEAWRGERVGHDK
jgi:ATP-dependent Zn protease